MVVDLIVVVVDGMVFVVDGEDIRFVVLANMPKRIPCQPDIPTLILRRFPWRLKPQKASLNTSIPIPPSATLQCPVVKP
jgi:hypothetical protein